MSNPSITITRRFEFDSGHRVYGHEGKCANWHGHRYVLDVECWAKELDDIGRVIDFSRIKSIIGKWIDDKLDHGMILFKDDDIMTEFAKCNSEMKTFIMDKNPTAENMSELLYDVFTELMEPFGITIISITLWETPNCKAYFAR